MSPRYDQDQRRQVYDGATLPSPCPHGWNEACPHCMAGEINRTTAEIARLTEELARNQAQGDLK